MKEKIHKEFLDWLADRIAYYCDVLMVPHTVSITCEPTADLDTYMDVEVASPYLRATVGWSLELFKDWQAGLNMHLIERDICHECLHIVLSDLTHLGEHRFVTQKEYCDAEEKAVEHLALVIEKLLL